MSSSRQDVACVIVGAGPAGLATAACLRRAGVPFRLIDRAGQSGGAYREIYDGITLASPAALDALPGLPLDVDGAAYITVPAYRDYLKRYASDHGLAVEAGDVRSVARAGRGFAVETAAGFLRTRFVVVATGMWSTPTHPLVEGIGTCGVPYLHAGRWRGPDPVAAGALLIIGAATSAIEIAEEAARAGQPVTLAVRSHVRVARKSLLGRDVHHWIEPLARLPGWLAPGYCAARPTLPGTDNGFSRLRAEGRIAIRPGVIQIAPGGVALFSDGTTAQFAAVCGATGYSFATPFLPADVARAAAGHVLARRCESTSWPGLFVVGSPCADRLDSEFLRGIARDSQRVARVIGDRAGGRES